MRKLTILVDMDDVLENLVERWVDTLNERYGTSVAYGDVTTWDIASIFPSLTKEQVFSPLYDDAFWQTLSTLPKSAENLRRLIDDGHTVRIVTASYYETLPSKMDWLFKHYPYLDWNDVIVAHDKKLICGDVLIDDAIHNLEGGKYEKILFSRPYNLGYDARSNGMNRVHGWDDIYEVIQRIANAQYAGANLVYQIM